MTYDRAEQPREVNPGQPQPSPWQSEYLQSLPPIPTSTADKKNAHTPFEAAAPESFEPNPETREERSERLLQERERTLGVFTNQITDSIRDARYDNHGPQTPEDQARETEGRRLIERAIQMVSNLVEDRNDHTGSNNVDALFHRINAQLRADGSPYLLTRSNPTDRSLDNKGSEFQGIKVLDINSGRSVEHFDVSTNTETHEASERANALLRSGAGFGSGIDREQLSETLQRLHNSYGMAGVNNFINRLYHANLTINVMQRPALTGTEFSGISLHPSGSPSSYHDVIWFHDRPNRAK